jgi:hypothetical protein
MARYAALRTGAVTPVRSGAKRARDRRRRYTTLPIWAARITEHVYMNGQHRINVVTKGGKPRTLTMKR